MRVKDNAKVYDGAHVSGCKRCENGLVMVGGESQVYGNAHLSAYEDECVQVYGNAKVFERVSVYDNAQIYGDAQIYGEANIWDDTQIYGTAEVFGYACYKDGEKISEGRHDGSDKRW